MTRRLLPSILMGLALVLLALGAGEAFVQHRQDEYVRAMTREALEGSAGRDFDSKVTALRDYVRAHVRNIDFSARGRPFLRDTAADTLSTGKGRCGEAARVFVNMARAAGIPAQRLYLEGRKAHVVTVVEAADGREIVVDATNRFYFPDIFTLDALKQHTEFDTYSTFGWRRLAALRSLPSNFVNLGALSYLLENPHALLASLCLLSSALTLALAAFVRRRLPRRSPQPFQVQEGFPVPSMLEGEGAEA
ncbi:MAG: Transglutaminase-like superfamily [Acidobacteriota bacterium]|jgi:hypothetical protein|nr:Transglutaminase-like superfamily [Acidobacteriota bacterium]